MVVGKFLSTRCLEGYMKIVYMPDWVMADLCPCLYHCLDLRFGKSKIGR